MKKTPVCVCFKSPISRSNTKISLSSFPVIIYLPHDEKHAPSVTPESFFLDTIEIGGVSGSDPSKMNIASEFALIKIECPASALISKSTHLAVVILDNWVEVKFGLLCDNDVSMEAAPGNIFWKGPAL